MKFFANLLKVVFLTTSAATANERTLVDLSFEVAESRIELAEHILRSAVDFAASEPEINARDGYLGLKTLLNNTEHFGALLLLDEEGILRFDSFNVEPLSYDLSDRQYFRETRSLKPKTMRIGSTMVARQSGQILIPFTMAVPSTKSSGQSVIALTVPPAALLPKTDVCAFCGIAIINEGEILASNRPMSTINEAVLTRLDTDGLYGGITFEINKMNVDVFWRRSEASGLVYLYYSATPKHS